MGRINWKLKYHPDVKKKDLPKIDVNHKEGIKRAIKERLLEHPLVVGESLRGTLKGYRKLRFSSYRIIYKIDKPIIKILIISHRREVYENIEKRKDTGK